MDIHLTIYQEAYLETLLKQDIEYWETNNTCSKELCQLQIETAQDILKKIEGE